MKPLKTMTRVGVETSVGAICHKIQKPKIGRSEELDIWYSRAQGKRKTFRKMNLLKRRWLMLRL